jgi:hypothetical protein
MNEEKIPNELLNMEVKGKCPRGRPNSKMGTPG